MRDVVWMWLSLALAGNVLPYSTIASAQTRFAFIHRRPARFADAQERAEFRARSQLLALGFNLVPREQIQQVLGESDCDRACADDINRLLGTSFAVLVEVLGTGNRPQLVNVALISNREGTSVGGQAAVDRNTTIEQAAEQATHQALDRYAADTQGYVVVDSEPSGGMVSMDGAEVGVAPVRRLLPRGRHRVSVSLAGYAVFEEEVEVTAHGEHTIRAQLVSAANIATPTPTPSAAPGPDVGLLLAGGGLIALGLVLFAVLPLPTLLQNGQCTLLDGSTCVEGHAFGAASWTLSVVSLSSVAAGVVLSIWGLNTETTNTASTAGNPTLRMAF